MRSDDLFRILLRAAEISGRTEFVVIGSQALHGTIPDPEVDAVIRSPDVDLYPVSGYTPFVYEELMRELGQDSDFHIESGHYIEAVPETLARFPEGWERRASSRTVGTVEVNGNSASVSVVFPEIHDLAVAKLAVRRDKDLEFVRDLIKLGALEHDVLRDRFKLAPRTDPPRISEGLNDIDEAFRDLKNGA